ncbi:unnamed protein product [Mytilus coruscus]|uniref:CUB domain-containing protein n=1 Tax=Mytilus coruscus TaxID=42192 RepID=A0A6J8DCM2_MYTCO|nr:unnamed protein product [Mytilus coruscus]
MRSLLVMFTTRISLTMDSDVYCGKAIDIYDREYVINARADVTTSNPNHRCVITIRSGYTDSYYGIQITQQMIDINDCGVKLNIYEGSSPGGTIVKRLSCTTKGTGILYSKYGIVTFELITPAQLYNPRNDFSIKVKTFQIQEGLKDSVAKQNTNMDNLNETDDVNTRIGKLQQQIISNSAREPIANLQNVEDGDFDNSVIDVSVYDDELLLGLVDLLNEGEIESVEVYSMC